MQSQVHEPKMRVLKIEVKMQALAHLQAELKPRTLWLAPDAVGLTGLDALEDANQPFLDSVFAGDLPGDVLFARPTRANVNDRAGEFLGESLGRGFELVRRPLGELSEVLELHMLRTQIRLQHRRAIERAQSPPQPQSIKSF